MICWEIYYDSTTRPVNLASVLDRFLHRLYTVYAFSYLHVLNSTPLLHFSIFMCYISKIQLRIKNLVTFVQSSLIAMFTFAVKFKFIWPAHTQVQEYMD